MHKICIYLIKNLEIECSNQVWGMDITYISIKGGYLYLVAIIDLYSCFVVRWSLSNIMTTKRCKQALDTAIENYVTPEILNTDQGSQFTALEFSNYVTKNQHIRLSMDGKGRAIDNIFIERLWRSLKYENVYLFPADDRVQCYRG